MTRVVIAGGGTAGHVQPALAVGRVLARRGHQVSFVGSRRGLEATLIPEAGFEVTLLPGRGVVRHLSWEAVAAVAGITAAAVEAVWLLARHRPSVVLSVGGYAAVPCAVAALLLRIPLVIAEANAVPGAANRLASRWASASAVAFAGTGLRHEVLTGNPIREEVASVSRTPAARAAARAALDVPTDAVFIVATGGSLGARRINQAVRDVAAAWADRDRIVIHHVIGTRDWASFATPATPNYRTVEYEDRIPLLLSAADVWVGRAGGSTVAELTAAGVPSILVPLPIAPDAGASVVIPDRELDGERLAAELDAVLTAPEALEHFTRAAAAMGHPDAASRVADLVEEHGG
jgi:UDP-N-acetylglucosamine--N-acetylmuramyl-(pentapeptide) pyrophosphoryl-undecaprenol N-acetylglucosamine transferase